jgi:hypothetical protein
MEEVTREIVSGLSSHYELAGQTIPERVAKALEGITAISRSVGKQVRGRPILITRSFGFLATRLATPVGSRAMPKKSPRRGKVSRRSIIK